MTSIPSDERTPAENVTSCDCGCVCCGPSDVNSASVDEGKTENAVGASGCGCGCSG